MLLPLIFTATGLAYGSDPDIGLMLLGNYYSSSTLWGGVIPPTVWLLGLGIASLVLEQSDSGTDVSQILNNEEVTITPVVLPDKFGIMTTLKLP